jgi:hypothetical protein
MYLTFVTARSGKLTSFHEMMNSSGHACDDTEALDIAGLNRGKVKRIQNRSEVAAGGTIAEPSYC